MENKQSLDFIKALLNGEKIKCPKCKEGVLKMDLSLLKAISFIALIAITQLI